MAYWRGACQNGSRSLQSSKENAMRITLVILILISSFLSCARGYKEGEPLTGEELALAKKANEMLEKADDLNEDVPSAIGETWKGFLTNGRLFVNSCQRHSCNSLEARNDFN